MNDLTSYFGSKKERDDFFIAIAVILFFIFFLGYGFFGKAEVPLVEEIQEVVEAPIVVIEDSDEDGVPDSEDECPLRAGTKKLKGCPADTDGDGIYDADDKCPGKKGPAGNNGCPYDSDKDGVANNDDKCPNIPGVKANAGCPSDKDKDGVYDKDDKCPNQFGRTKSGCPKPRIADEDKAILKAAMKSVEFDTGKATLKGNSQMVLNQIHTMMKKYPKYRLDISGHTDNTGDAAKNLQLSKDRAQACYDYLKSKGISERKLSFKGLGSRQPIDSNDTGTGRQNNRRVEFKFNN